MAGLLTFVSQGGCRWAAAAVLRPKPDQIFYCKLKTENGKLFLKENGNDMAATFHRCLVVVFDAEGGFSDNPEDRGGPTNFGITAGFLESIGYGKTPDELTRDEARELNQKYFWEPVRGDDAAPAGGPGRL